MACRETWLIKFCSGPSAVTLICAVPPTAGCFCPICDNRRGWHGGYCLRCRAFGWFLTVLGAAFALWILGMIANWETL